MCYDGSGDEAIEKNDPKSSKTIEELSDCTKLELVKEERPLKQGTYVKETSSYPTFLCFLRY